jgi:hypothetical protein
MASRLRRYLVYRRSPPGVPVTNLYAVVGEHMDNPDHFLVLGEDGRYYDWDLANEETRLVEPGDEWTIDAEVPDGELLFEDVFIDP